MTGYERAESMNHYHVVSASDYIATNQEYHSGIDDDFYNVANYYSSKTVAENNARADKLMRQLRRFAVENRKKELDFYSIEQEKFFIYCVTNDFNETAILTAYHSTARYFGVVYFDSKGTALKAIEQFHDELIWYFTEYKDSCGLPEPKEQEQEEPEIQKFSTDDLLNELRRRAEQ